MKLSFENGSEIAQRFAGWPSELRPKCLNRLKKESQIVGEGAITNWIILSQV
jgi:hypothetical protein